MSLKMDMMSGFKILLEKTLLPFIAQEHKIELEQLQQTLTKFFAGDVLPEKEAPKKKILKTVRQSHDLSEEDDEKLPKKKNLKTVKQSHDLSEEDEKLPKKNLKKIVTHKPVKSDDDDDLSEEERAEKYLAMKMTDLKDLLKSKGMTQSGVKAKLVNRLLGRDENVPITVPAPKKAVSPKKKKDHALPKVVALVEPEEYTLVQNSYGNWVVEINGVTLVMKKDSNDVIGIQHEDGEVLDLDSEALDICKQYNFKYSLPDFIDEDAVKPVEESDQDE